MAALTLQQRLQQNQPTFIYVVDNSTAEKLKILLKNDSENDFKIQSFYVEKLLKLIHDRNPVDKKKKLFIKNYSIKTDYYT